MNLLDLLLILMLTYSAFRGYRQGALSQVLAFGGAGLGLVLGSVAAPALASLFVDRAGPALALLTLVLLLGFVFAAQGVGFAVGLRLRAAAHEKGAGAVDRSAGIAVGLVGLVLTVWLLGSALAQGPSPAIAQQLQGSRIATAIGEALPPPPDVLAQVGTYLDQQGFPQVFSGIGGGATAPPVPPPAQASVASAQAAGQPSTVQIESVGCGGISSGTGFVVQHGFVVTNAHVVAGGQTVTVRAASGEHAAVPVYLDAGVDLAVLASPTLDTPSIPWVEAAAERGTEGATLGYPGGQRQLVVKAAAVRGRGEAVGRDIYGRELIAREILTLSAPVARGDSGGPFVTATGQVAGVVFAAAAADPDTGYAITAEQARPPIEAAVAANQGVPTGPCRF